MPKRGRTSRRELLLQALRLGAGAALLPTAARAFGEGSRFAFAQVRHGGRWDPRPDGLGRLAWEVSKRTSIETSPASRSLGA